MQIMAEVDIDRLLEEIEDDNPYTVEEYKK